MFFKILAFIFLIAGVFMVYAARWLVRKWKLDEKVECNFEHEMNREELTRFKVDKATLNIKMLGMLIALPGLILIIILFR